MRLALFFSQTALIFHRYPPQPAQTVLFFPLQQVDFLPMPAFHAGLRPPLQNFPCPVVLHFAVRQFTARKIVMKTQTTVIGITAALFATIAFADHNRTDEQGRKHGHWTEFVGGIGESEGYYVNGKAQGHWVQRLANGDVFEGPFANGKRHGYWVFRGADGSMQKGRYMNDMRHGRWVQRSADGNVHEGTFANDKQHGHWVIRHADGSVSAGHFANGKRHGYWVGS